MKAALRYSYASPSQIILEEIPKPEPGANEICIKVMATTVNRTDCAILRAKPLIMRLLLGLFKPRQPILGTDFAGIVEAVGSQITTFKSGDRVWGFGDDGIGSQAEFVCLSSKKGVAFLPKSINFSQGVAAAEGAHYAINMLNKVQHQPNQKAMVNGGTGAIGSAMIQLLRYHNIEVTATCRDEHFDLVKNLGARRCIDYLKDDFTKDQEQYDFVFDTVGKSTFGACRTILKQKGTYISSEFGPYGQNLWYTLFTPLFGSKRVKFPVPLNIKRSLNFMNKLMEEQKFVPLIDREFPFRSVNEAYTLVESGQKLGNVILKITD